MNYKIINDKEKLIEFIDWLPELKHNEVFYCCLLARSKYCKDIKHISSDKQQVKRFTATKEYLLEKIQQLECEIGSYTQKHNPIPQEALALYITPNPRCLEKATNQTLLKFTRDLVSKQKDFNPLADVMTEIQTACSRKVYLDFDFDDVNVKDVLEELKHYINLDCVKFLQARGGFHMLIETGKIDKAFSGTWYENILKVKGVDWQRNRDNMIPIAGCYQGGFTPTFIKA